MRAVVFGADCVCFDRFVSAALRAAGCEVIEAADEFELLAMVRDGSPDLVTIQLACDAAHPLAPVARRVRQADRTIPLFFVVAERDDALTLAAMRAGANDLLTAHSTEGEIAEAIERIREEAPPSPPVTILVAGNRLVGHSKPLETIRKSIQRVSMSDSNVLITGETGTGKELTAELIHANSPRRERPFVSINCAAIPEGLLESELFGYERGAFTGAYAARVGKLQYAQGGTLFLDEVGDMTLLAQAKILRAIESRKVQRLGGNREVAVNIRIIAATNQNLEQLTSQQKFRQDLYFRLNVARLQLPPLRDHRDDIPELVETIVEEMGRREGRSADSVDSSLIDALLHYGWPGNVRELRNVIESALVFSTNHRVSRRDLPPYIRALFASEERKSTNDREVIAGALAKSGWNRNEAARLLGCSRMTLYRKMVKYDLFDGERDRPRNATIGA